MSDVHPNPRADAFAGQSFTGAPTGSPFAHIPVKATVQQVRGERVTAHLSLNGEYLGTQTYTAREFTTRFPDPVGVGRAAEAADIPRIWERRDGKEIVANAQIVPFIGPCGPGDREHVEIAFFEADGNPAGYTQQTNTVEGAVGCLERNGYQPGFTDVVDPAAIATPPCVAELEAVAAGLKGLSADPVPNLSAAVNRPATPTAKAPAPTAKPAALKLERRHR